MPVIQPGAKLRHRVIPLGSGQAEVWLERQGAQVAYHQKYETESCGSGSGSGHWSKCAVEGCLGEAVIAEGRCLRHATTAERSAYVSSVRSSGRALSLRGVEVDQGLLDDVLGPWAQLPSPVHLSLYGAEILGE